MKIEVLININPRNIKEKGFLKVSETEEIG